MSRNAQLSISTPETESIPACMLPKLLWKVAAVVSERIQALQARTACCVRPAIHGDCSCFAAVRAYRDLGAGSLGFLLRKARQQELLNQIDFMVQSKVQVRNVLGSATETSMFCRIGIAIGWCKLTRVKLRMAMACDIGCDTCVVVSIPSFCARRKTLENQLQEIQGRGLWHLRQGTGTSDLVEVARSF